MEDMLAAITPIELSAVKPADNRSTIKVGKSWSGCSSPGNKSNVKAVRRAIKNPR